MDPSAPGPGRVQGWDRVLEDTDTSGLGPLKSRGLTMSPYLEKYMAHSTFDHLCKLYVDSACTKTGVVHDFCLKVVDG